MNHEQQQIMRNVVVRPITRCWIWTAAINSLGYGRVRRAAPRRLQLAHRASYEIFIGAIPSRINVLHKCDTPRCVNPDHLFLGTQSENIVDCSTKGRLVDNRGTKHGMCKLQEVDVLNIRSSDLPNRRLAEQFGISDTTVRLIRSRKTWRHL